jgi:hypothetical protein
MFNKNGISKKKWLLEIIFINFVEEGVRCDASYRLLRNTLVISMVLPYFDSCDVLW